MTLGQKKEWLCKTNGRETKWDKQKSGSVTQAQGGYLTQTMSCLVKQIKVNVALNSRYQNNDHEHVTHFILAMKGQLQRKRDWLFGKESLALRNKQQSESEVQTKGSF